jgi:hypothetical protein
MNILDDDDPPSSAQKSPARDLVKEAEVLTDPMKVILDIRKDIEKFQNGGPRKELVDALRDQFIATRHQAATKAEAVRILALNMLQARLPEMKSTPELLKTISALSEISKNDLAVLLGALPGQAPLINLQQVIGLGASPGLALPEREDSPIKGASHALESFEHLLESIKATVPHDPAGKEENNRDDAEAVARPPTLRLLNRE